MTPADLRAASIARHPSAGDATFEIMRAIVHALRLAPVTATLAVSANVLMARAVTASLGRRVWPDQVSPVVAALAVEGLVEVERTSNGQHWQRVSLAGTGREQLRAREIAQHQAVEV